MISHVAILYNDMLRYLTYQVTVIPYHDNGVDLEGFVAIPEKRRCPLVILCHAWRGRDEFICEKARQVAKLDYVGFALDMYGKGILGKSKEENMALKRPFIKDRYLVHRRVIKALEADWQIHIYGNAMHAFATTGANDPDAGILYNPVAADRAWITLKNFLAEVFV